MPHFLHNKENILEYNTVNDRNIGILTMVMSLITLSITSDMELASDDGIIVSITNVVLDWRKPVYKVLMYIRRVHRELVWLDSYTLRAFE